jgi:hypothetical protein
MQGAAPVTFKPRPSDKGRAWLIICGAIFLACLPVVVVWPSTPWLGAIWGVILVLIVPPIIILFARTASAVSYTLEADTLVLKYGRLVNYRIPYRTIRSVRNYNLRSRERAPMDGNWALLPGLDTTAYRTDDAGVIKLLATVSSGYIVLIEADSGNYGINPKDEANFTSSLRRMIRK